MSDLEHKSIERIKMASEMALHHYGQPLICTYSGGKDSDVMLELFKRAGVPFEVMNSHTTVDAPQTVYHIRDTFRRLELEGIKCSIDYHEKIVDGKKTRTTMWNLIASQYLPPTRNKRYCCSKLKEEGGRNRMVAIGIRTAESTMRRSDEAFETRGKRRKDSIAISDEKMLLTDNDDTRRLIEQCQLKAKTVVNPIIDWRNSDVWDFYWNECPKHNDLYKNGYDRIGCIGCPMARRKVRLKQFNDFPTYQAAYIRAFDAMLDRLREKGLKDGKRTGEWQTGEDVFRWWMEDPNIEGQITLDEWMEEQNGST